MNACEKNGIPIPPYRAFEPPERVYKKCCGSVIVVAEIPKDAEVRGNLGKKCRANKAKIVDIIGTFAGERVGVSVWDKTTMYMVGDEIEIADFDKSDQTCSTGYHFFCTQVEAKAY